MLDKTSGGPGQERLEFNGRRQYPERLHVIAMTIDITTRLLMELDTFFTATTQETSAWAYPTDPQLTPATRHRLRTIERRRSTLSNRQRSTGVANRRNRTHAHRDR